ncbi:hypothetical protein HQ587_08215 [bacterium]|nr:hypothetical protein [bacterium]
MKKTGVILTVIISFVMSLLTIHPVQAEEVTGCPLGLKKGVIWLRSSTGYTSADKVYWNANHAEDPEITDILDDWHARTKRIHFRVGYGLMDRLDIGVALEYLDKDIKKQVWKCNQQSTWTPVWKSNKAHGFGDVWFTAKYKLIADRDRIEAVSVGLGLKLDAADDPLVTKGIGTGTKDIRLCVLSHLNHGLFHSCCHIFYESRGEVREIEVKNSEGQMVPWTKSDWNLGDKLNYKFNIEYGLNEAGTFHAHLAAVGWLKFEDKNANDDKVSDSDRYEHSLYPKIVFLPEGENEEHRKVAFGLKIPLSVKKDFSSMIQPKLTMMWTFG